MELYLAPPPPPQACLKAVPPGQDGAKGVIPAGYTLETEVKGEDGRESPCRWEGNQPRLVATQGPEAAWK